MLQLPAVADKTFLITIGDRTVGGLCARDPMVGPWQVPVADVAVTLMDFDGHAGEAIAIGERTPLALRRCAALRPHGGRRGDHQPGRGAIERLGAIKLSANWMAAAGHPGEDAALYDTVRAVAMELCPALGISIPVGKDSISMRTAWREGGVDKSVTAPVSLDRLGIRPGPGRAADADAAPARAMPARRSSSGFDLSRGRHRLGGSALAQVYAQLGDQAPDVDDPAALRGFFAAVQALHGEGRLLAYHDIGDGGLVVTLCEMAFASRAALDIVLPGDAEPLAVLFAEELGAVVQVRAGDAALVVETCARHRLASRAIGRPAEGDRVTVAVGETIVLDASRRALHRTWSATTHAMQRLRDHPQSADEEYARIDEDADPGITPRLTFEVAPAVHAGARPAVAILREQGVNGQVELAAAFTRAGFDAYDVHMSDILAGREDLARFQGLAAGGGFSYGDVLGAGEGWAKSILFNARARDAFAAFFGRGDSFAIGICNGCQMMSNLHELIPGTAHWPHFVRNRSEQFEARLVTLEVLPSPSLFFRGMAGSRIPVATAHGEGYAEFRDAAQREAARGRIALRYVDNRGMATETYPFNPNGSPDGITGLCNDDGRVTILMPHPERVFRTVQMSWHPADWPEDSPWMQMFYNARRWMD